MFTDQYIDREENSKIKEVVFQFLTTSGFKLDQIDADDPEVFINLFNFLLSVIAKK